MNIHELWQTYFRTNLTLSTLPEFIEHKLKSASENLLGIIQDFYIRIFYFAIIIQRMHQQHQVSSTTQTRYSSHDQEIPEQLSSILIVLA